VKNYGRSSPAVGEPPREQSAEDQTSNIQRRLGKPSEHTAGWTPVAAPAGDLPAALAGTERPALILHGINDLERLMADLSLWLKEWHLQLLGRSHWESDSGASPGAGADQRPVPFPDLANLFQDTANAVFRDNPLFRQLTEKVPEMRQMADRIAEQTRVRGTIPAKDYGEFMNAIVAFHALVRQLQGETWNRLANIDPLTGIGNRPAMLRKLAIECERQARNRHPCCVAMLDLDFFKRINDTHGHSAGDVVLRSVASLLASSIRPYDEVFRYGGEEFVLCLPNADCRSAWAIVERLRLRIAAWSIPIKPNILVRMTVSVGVAPLSVQGGVEAALEAADRALYTAKRNGRNTICVNCP
jgi:diguanylate cyclase (GGDEF)-like protein